MNYYVVQVRTGKELSFVNEDEQNNKQLQKKYSIIFPQRVLNIRKGGVFTKKQSPVFPGYVFIATEEFSNDLYTSMKKLHNFYRFLPSNEEPRSLQGRDLDILKHFISFGNVADFSVATFDENDRIVIVEGPLKGLEGYITKVNKRKGRATVCLDMYQDSFRIDLGFTMLDPTGKKGERIKHEKYSD